MLKILPIATALLAATTLWGQMEPVGVTVGQTVRLNVSARPPDSCAAQLGFLDSAGKSVGPSSHVSLQPGQSATLDLPASVVVKEAGQRVVVLPRIVPDSGTAASSCQADLEVNEAKPSGGSREDVKVHGHWTIDVRNPDGSLASHRDFENSLTPSGGGVLVGSLSRASVTGLWRVQLNALSAPGPCNSTFNCNLVEPAETSPLASADSNNVIVSTPTSGPNSGKLVLAVSVTVAGAGVFYGVATYLDVCAVGVIPTGCTIANILNPGDGQPLFTSALITTNVSVVPGQFVQVTVVLSFS
jgi:hypothetical protein